MKKVFSILICLVLLGSFNLPIQNNPQLALADGFIDFEDGIDGQPIRSSIPGLQFTTTDGYDWIYGDWTTGNYNGPYPLGGSYYSNGNFFAWLGPNQGKGRIDFTQGCATYLQVWVSSLSGVTAEGYSVDGTLLTYASVNGNLGTGRLERLRIDAPTNTCMSYVLIHDTGNFWLIDDLTTDAGGVPTTRPPVVFIPGLMGSYLRNNDQCLKLDYEVWPAVLLNSASSSLALETLKLDISGQYSASSCDVIYPNGPITNIAVKQFYGPLIDYLQNTMGFSVYSFGYDWRLDIKSTANELSKFIDKVLEETGSQKVSIVDHSLGGLVARYYVATNSEAEAKVEQVVSIGTPFLGTPKSFKGLRFGDNLPFIKQFGLIGLLNPLEVKGVLQNLPAIYEILPSRTYVEVFGSGYYTVDGARQSWIQTQNTLLSKHNNVLPQMADEFHSDDIDKWDISSVKVPYRLIVGSGAEDTIGVYHERTVLNWSGVRVYTWDVDPINGDGTVPLLSADLKGKVDHSGGVPIWYADGIQHLDLVTEDYILEFIGAILATPPNMTTSFHSSQSEQTPRDTALALYQGDHRNFPEATATDTVPPPPPEMSTDPFPLNGGQITTVGAVELHVYDSLGNHTGTTNDGKIDLGIDGSGYEVLGDKTFITVPAMDTYTVTVDSTGADEFTLRIRNLKGTNAASLINRTIVFADAPIGSAGEAELVYNPDNQGPTENLAIDQNKDGSPDLFYPATGDLGPADSYDITPPTVTVKLDGKKEFGLWYTGLVTVTVDVEDDQSGVAKIDYSIDKGSHIFSYTEPFTVNSFDVPVLIVKATDKAGNEGWVSVSLGPFTRLFLPISLR